MEEKIPASQIEEDFNFYIVDLFAKEYGWSVEYIQNLELPQIAKLVKAIKKRKDLEDQLMQINIAKGMSGKISSNWQKDIHPNQEQELRNLERLAKMLGQKTHKVKEDK